MPIIKSAKKRVKVTKKRTAYNKAIKGKVKSALNTARKQIDKDPKSKKIEELIKKAVIELDKGSSKGVIHKNTAARKKSRLMKKLHKSLQKGKVVNIKAPSSVKVPASAKATADKSEGKQKKPTKTQKKKK